MPLPALAQRLPSRCEICRGWGRTPICEACLARFAAPRARCARCGIGLALAAATCIACSRDAPPFARTVCAVDYAFPWDRLIVRFKFDARAELAGVLAALLTRAVLADGASGAPAAGLVVPVPLAAQRLAERGFNQAWELAHRVASALALPAAAMALTRVLDTPHQVRLTRAERARNLANAFVPAERQRVAGNHVALVDDVLTTGATAAECAAALQRAGAASVQLWVLARAP